MTMQQMFDHDKMVDRVFAGIFIAIIFTANVFYWYGRENNQKIPHVGVSFYTSSTPVNQWETIKVN